MPGGSYSLTALVQSAAAGNLGVAPDGAVFSTLLNVSIVLVLLGAITKSALIPFHFWLPGAMAAPTPVSAYLHSATMVKAGIYLVARFAPAFAEAGPWRPLVVSVGLTTMVVGGWRALRPVDLKQVLAFGTISQLGLMMVLFGAGTPETTFAGCTLLIAHGIFKASLFMLVGVVDHQAHTRDLRHLDMLCSCHGSRTGVLHMRKFISTYVRGMRDAAHFRVEACILDKPSLLTEKIDEFFDRACSIEHGHDCHFL